MKLKYLFSSIPIVFMLIGCASPGGQKHLTTTFYTSETTSSTHTTSSTTSSSSKTSSSISQTLTIIPEKEEIEVGELIEVIAKLDNQTTTQVSWSTDDPEIVSVSGGWVQGLKVGTAKIIGTYLFDTTIKAECFVNVKETSSSSSSQTSREKQTLTLHPRASEVQVGDWIEIVAKIDGIVTNAVNWRSLNPAVASIESGWLNALSSGTATIKATYLKDTSVEAECTVEVLNKPEPSTSSSSETTTSSETPTSSESSSSSSELPYKITLTTIPSNIKTIKASKTVNLNARVVGSPDDTTLIWESLNPDIASVEKGTSNTRGIVTGIKEGKATIQARLFKYPSVSAQIEFTIEKAEAPTSISINGIENNSNQWVGEDIQLEVVPTPSTATSFVDWQSSNNAVAEVDKDNVIHFKSQGDVTITAKSVADASITKTLNLHVKNGTFLSNGSATSSHWDISHQADDTNPYVKLTTANIGTKDSENYNSLYFAHVKGQRYYVEAYFHIDEQTAMAKRWDWGGFGLVHGLNDENARSYTFAPHSPFHPEDNHNKTVVRDRGSGGWTVGVARRSQVWGEFGLNNLNFYNGSIKIAMLRDNNNYYYLIGDKLMWYDECSKYDEKDTIPSIYSEDYAITVSNFWYTQDENWINNKLATPDFKDIFGITNAQFAEKISSSSYKITTPNQENKFAKLRNLGDKGHLIGEFTFECDINEMALNEYRYQNQSFAGLTFNFARYEDTDIVSSIMLGASKKAYKSTGDSSYRARYVMWDYSGVRHISDAEVSPEDCSYPESWAESDSLGAIPSLSTSHLKIERKFNGTKQTLNVYVNNVLVNWSNIGEDADGTKETYTGDYIIWLGGEYCAGTLSNIKFTNGNIL